MGTVKPLHGTYCDTKIKMVVLKGPLFEMQLILADKYIALTSVAEPEPEPEPQGAASFGRIRIRIRIRKFGCQIRIRRIRIRILGYKINI
jgi:hypothetical protein